MWFKREKDEITGELIYKSNGQYWKCKESQDWTGCPEIYLWYNGYDVDKPNKYYLLCANSWNNFKEEIINIKVWNEGDIGQQPVDVGKLGMKEICNKGLITNTVRLLPNIVRNVIILHVLSRNSEQFVKNFFKQFSAIYQR